MLESLLNHDVHATSQASTSWWSDRSSGHCDCSRRGLEISADPGCSDQISTFLTRWKFFSVFVLKLIHWDLFLFFCFYFVALLLCFFSPYLKPNHVRWACECLCGSNAILTRLAIFDVPFSDSVDSGLLFTCLLAWLTVFLTKSLFYSRNLTQVDNDLCSVISEHGHV